jgi:hypothetical protein
MIEIDYYNCYIKHLTWQITKIDWPCRALVYAHFLVSIAKWVYDQIAKLLALLKKLNIINVFPDSRDSAIQMLFNQNSQLNKLIKAGKTKTKDVLQSRKSQSCLCGGTEKVYCCYPEQDPDWCYQKDKSGNFITDNSGKKKLRPLCGGWEDTEPCFRCSWRCVRDEKSGKITKELIDDPLKKLRCCPGTPLPKNTAPCTL